MDFLRRIELGGLVALLTAIVGLAVFFGGLDKDVKNLKERVKELKDDEIKTAQEKALENFQQEVEKITEEAKEKIASLEAKELKDNEIKTAQEKALENFQQEVEKITEEAKEKIASLEAIENVRAIVTKSDADKICSSKPGSKATYVPFSYIGKTGQEICAANYDNNLKKCSQVPFVWVSNNNTHGRYQQNDKKCGDSVQAPWPWINQYTEPNTNTVRDGRPYADSWVVCCF
ncbi:MAG: hypothetical protein QNJ74_14195 [Trichodesmium sp. MO_231.B1]|nr:hypothetical protein [Trichodesmium sp. MO_231.B1]